MRWRSWLPSGLDIQVNRLLAREGLGPIHVEAPTSVGRGLALTSTHLLIVQAGGFTASGQAIALRKLTSVLKKQTAAGIELTIQQVPGGAAQQGSITLVVDAAAWPRVARLLARMRSFPAYRLDSVDPGEIEARRQHLRSALIALLEEPVRRRNTAPVELEQFSTKEELTVLYGPMVLNGVENGPKTVAAVTYLSGIPAFEGWLERENTKDRAYTELSNRQVRFDDVGTGLVIRIEPTWVFRTGYGDGHAVHLRHDIVNAVSIRENARAAVLDEQASLDGGFVGVRLFGRLSAGVAGMSGLERSEAIGSAVLTIEARAPSRTYQLNFAVKSTRLDPVRYFFQKLYRDRFTFVEEGTGGTVSQPRSSAARELDMLTELHERGILTDEEFQAAKARLMG